MEVVLIECPGDRRVLLCGRLLVYAEWIAEQIARAAGVGVQVHHVRLPADFHACDEDDPLPCFTPEDVARWWVAMCDGQAEEEPMAAPPPAYPRSASSFSVSLRRPAWTQPTRCGDWLRSWRLRPSRASEGKANDRG